MNSLSIKAGRPWRRWFIAGGLLFALLAWGTGTTASVVLAHGKEVTVTVSSLAPDKDSPLTRLYRIAARFSDGDPLTGGHVQLVARRSQGGLEAGPVNLSPLNEPGLYAGEIAYPRFGAWTVTVTVRGDEGEGTNTFTEELLPGVATQSNTQSGQEPVRSLAVQFRFGARDVAHILGRISHSIAGTAYIALTGAVFLAIWWRARETKPEVWKWLRRAFFPATLAAGGVLLTSGLYSGYYDAPVRPPGVFYITALGHIRYGYAYLVVFWLKAPLAVALLAIAWRMHRTMNHPYPAKPIAGALVKARDSATGAPQPRSPSDQLLLRLSLVYVALGLLLLANIAVLIYLHYISHLAAIVAAP